MDEKLKQLMEELGFAIDESIRESKSIVEAIAKIKMAGYDVFMVLEATIVFNKKPENQEKAQTDTGINNLTKSKQPLGLKFTKNDEEFLGEMKISLGDDAEKQDDKKSKKRKRNG